MKIEIVYRNNERDYEGSMAEYQKQLDDAGINFDVSALAGAAESEINATVKYLLSGGKVEYETI